MKDTLARLLRALGLESLEAGAPRDVPRPALSNDARGFASPTAVDPRAADHLLAHMLGGPVAAAPAAPAPRDPRHSIDDPELARHGVYLTWIGAQELEIKLSYSGLDVTGVRLETDGTSLRLEPGDETYAVVIRDRPGVGVVLTDHLGVGVFVGVDADRGPRRQVLHPPLHDARLPEPDDDAFAWRVEPFDGFVELVARDLRAGDPFDALLADAIGGVFDGTRPLAAAGVPVPALRTRAALEVDALVEDLRELEQTSPADAAGPAYAEWAAAVVRRSGYVSLLLDALDQADHEWAGTLLAALDETGCPALECAEPWDGAEHEPILSALAQARLGDDYFEGRLPFWLVPLGWDTSQDP